MNLTGLRGELDEKLQAEHLARSVKKELDVPSALSPCPDACLCWVTSGGRGSHGGSLDSPLGILQGWLAEGQA